MYIVLVRGNFKLDECITKSPQTPEDRKTWWINLQVDPTKKQL